MMADFFTALDILVAGGEMVVDRPAGTAHPRFPAVIYPVDYGYLAGTVSGDGEGVDFFRGSAVGLGLTAAIFTVDTGKRDVEVKLLIDCNLTEISSVEKLLSHDLHLGTRLLRRDSADLPREDPHRL